ncbi:MAG TPA: hypothetical protein PK057_08370 [Brevefilum fermentans]|nr:hypothetical protein [Brevefilum fermentans]
MKNEKKSAKPFIVFPCRVYPHAFLQAPYKRVKKLIDGDSQGTTPDVPSKASIPIVVEQDTTLGGLEGEPARVQIPAGAFMTDASASISYSDTLPALPEEGWTGLGATLNVELESAQTRSDQPMQVRMKFDAAGIKEPGEVFVGYYNEQHGWYFFKPDSVDLDQGVLTFTTFHFSQHAPFSAEEAKRIEKYLEQKATETFVKETTLGKSQEEVEAMVKTILEQGAGIKDNRVLEIITKGVVEQMPFGSIAVAIYDHDSEELTQSTLEETLKVLGKYVASDDNLLKEITSDQVKSFANDLTNNAILISDLNKFANRVVELSNEVITNVWFNPELEKAFQVYKNGAEGGWFGYSVDAQDWDQLSAQMRGVFAKVQSDYVSSYCNRRGINPDQLSEDERNAIARNGMEALKAQFDERLSNQEKIDEIKDKQEKLIELFANQQLLIRDSVNPMYAGQEDLEMLMNRLFLMTEKIMRDTGRTEIIFHSFDEDIDRPGTQIYGQQIAQLARTWYINREISPEQTEKAYHQALIDMGLIEDENLIHGVEPQKVTCTGDYVITFTNVYDDGSTRVCSFTIPFSLEFWNVGALGGAEYSGASYTWSYVNFLWDDCSVDNLGERVSTGEFSGGPDGHATIGWANFSLNSGATASISFSDEDENVSGSCTILNTSAFSGWK